MQMTEGNSKKERYLHIWLFNQGYEYVFKYERSVASGGGLPRVSETMWMTPKEQSAIVEKSWKSTLHSIVFFITIIIIFILQTNQI